MKLMAAGGADVGMEGVASRMTADTLPPVCASTGANGLRIGAR